jgi:hypothetical protein
MLCYLFISIYVIVLVIHFFYIVMDTIISFPRIFLFSIWYIVFLNLEYLSYEGGTSYVESRTSSPHNKINMFYLHKINVY